MKPSFALDFRDGRVTLLHRTSRGWSQVGFTSFEAPDFVEALGYLRSTALGLSPRGITTKLIIPNDQILYQQVLAPGPDAAKRKRQIRAAIDGLTPYALDDLVYDWWGTGPELQVAVVARETLAEAEAFATEHRFNPVSCVGVPENGAFLGEPFFGPTAAATTLLAEGEKVERDPDPVTVIARDFPRSETVVPTARKVAEPAPDQAPGSVAGARHAPAPVAPEPVGLETPYPAVGEPRAPVPTEAPQSNSATTDVERPDPAPLDTMRGGASGSDAARDMVRAAATPVRSESEAVRSAVTDTMPPKATLDQPPLPLVATTPAPTALEPAPAQDVAAPASRPTLNIPAWPLEVALPRKTDPKTPETKPVETRANPPVPEAPMAMDVVPEPAASGQDDDIPVAPAAEIVAAFASRRTAAIAAATAGSTKASASPVSKIPAVSAPPSARPAVPRPGMARPASGPGTRETVPFPQKLPTAPKAPISKSGKPGGASVTAPGILGARRERNVVPLPTAANPEGQEAAARRTAAKPGFGLGSKSLPDKGKPKYLGLILTGILLLLLAAVAAWSSFFMGANDPTGAGVPPADGSAVLSAPVESPQTPAQAEASNATETTAPMTAPPDAAAPADTAKMAEGSAAAGDATPPRAAADAGQLALVQPAPTEPAPTEPATTEQATTEPTMTEPAATEPASTQGTEGQRAAVQPAASQQSATGAVAPPAPLPGSPDVAMAAPDVPASQVPDAATTAVSTSSAATDSTLVPLASNAPTGATPPAPAAAPGTDANGSAYPDTAAAPAAPAAPAVEPAPHTEVSTLGLASAMPPSAAQDTIVVASADIPPRTVGLQALPTLRPSADASPAAEPPPPPFGTIYKFDAEGRIVPTPEGILTPEGVLLVAGKPKLTPPNRPADLTPQPTAAPALSAVTAPVAAAPVTSADSAPAAADAAQGASATPQASAQPTGAIAAAATVAPAVGPATSATPVNLPQDPTLRGKHPKDRPANLPVSLDPLGALPDASANIGVASLRPQARPGGLPSPIAANTGADVNTASASLAANGFALTSSPKPPARPASLKVAADKKAAVDRAVDAALDQAPPAQPAKGAVKVASNAAPEAEVEPEVQTKARTMPTNASVAKQATTRHALNSSRMALLAVFGSPSTRFAMVRQANGAVKKVQVGDSVDGGRIGAITENSVQYSKDGEILTLSLPTG